MIILIRRFYFFLRWAKTLLSVTLLAVFHSVGGKDNFLFKFPDKVNLPYFFIS